jgi:hypothetical protein
MARLPLITMVALALAGCSQNDVGRKVIAEQCIAEGETVEVCECFAKGSVEKLDKEMIDIVVLGAQGEDGETERLMQELSPSQKAHFTAAVREVISTCGGEGYLAGS